MALSISRALTLPTLLTGYSPGSRVVLPNGKEYILNNSKVWIPVHMMALEIKDNLTTEDLNNVLTAGIYHQKSSSYCSIDRNYPATALYAGVLQVLVDTDQIFQSYTILSGQPNENKTFTRGKYAGSWSLWTVPNYLNITQAEWNNVNTNSHTHSNKALLDSYNQTNVNLTTAVNNSHTHTNKTILDGITTQKIVNWDLSFGWGDHSTQGYLTNTLGDNRYLKILGLNQQINGNVKIIDTVNENKTYFPTGNSNNQLSYNEVSLSGFGITSNIINSTINSFNFGYKTSTENISFIEYDRYLDKWNIGKDAFIYFNALKLGTAGGIRTLTIDAAGKLGYIEGIALTNFNETDPTVPAYVKSITSTEKNNWNLQVDNYSTYLDLRIIKPNSSGIKKLGFGFTSYNNNNTGPWADYLHFGGYQDSSVGSQNLIVFNKSTFGIRQYQGTSQADVAYSTFVEFWHSDNFTQTNINNWNIAVGWGNHSTQNYLKATITTPTEDDILSYKSGIWKNISQTPTSYKTNFIVVDWIFNVAGYYQLLITHNLNSDIINVVMYNSTKNELKPESIVLINNNTVSIRITNEIDLRFIGSLLISKG